tara:strand:+ start:63 stop:680 length:618 start_codon:yes stop_codon:yes gene_type:complete
MAAMPMLAGVGLMMVCCSSSSAMMMMGGDGDDAAAGAGAGGGGGGGGGAKTGVSGRYVRVALNATSLADTAYALNIEELEVYDSTGTNIAAGKTATASTEYTPGEYQAGLAFDGSLDTMYHSLHNTTEDWLEVDLGSVKDIHKVIIKHPGDEDVHKEVAVKDRLRGHVIIKDGSEAIVKTTPDISITTADHTYTYDFTASSPAWA